MCIEWHEIVDIFMVIIYLISMNNGYWLIVWYLFVLNDTNVLYNFIICLVFVCSGVDSDYVDIVLFVYSVVYIISLIIEMKMIICVMCM